MKTVARDGATVSSYELQTALGRGSRSTTWRAACTTGGCHGQQVVLTSISPAAHHQHDHEPARLDNVLGIAQLWHPNLAKLLHVGRTGGQVYLVSEHIKGRSLQEVLQIYGECGQRMPQGLVLWALGITCAALAYLHERGLFHGGVSARKVMLAESGWVKLRARGSAGSAASSPSPAIRPRRVSVAIARRWRRSSTGSSWASSRTARRWCGGCSTGAARSPCARSARC